MDGISYAMLRNLQDEHLDALISHINQVWNTSTLPKKWKRALVFPVPKPNKPFDRITNLRPISLTSCMGKLMDKMLLKRLEWHPESVNALHPTIVGFIHHMRTQDAMLWIWEDVYQHPSNAQLCVIAGGEVHRAFDKVAHNGILKNLLSTYPGHKACTYIKIISLRQHGANLRTNIAHPNST